MDQRSPVNGVLVLDKPAGISSAVAVDVVRKKLGAAKAGHTGTLDPIATGVLPICLGEATKLAGYIASDDKAYDVQLVLGVDTDTLDRAGRVTETRDASAVTRDQLAAALARFVGEIDQVPPMFSAVRVDGVRLHKRARAGQDVERAARRVRVDVIELRAFESPRATIAVACGKGTYVRSLVADVGRALGCGAHVAELRRTRAGRFAIGDAVAIDRVVGAPLVALADATALPTLVVAAELAPRVLAGEVLDAVRLGAPASPCFQIVDPARRLLAIGHSDAGRLKYDRVFHP